MKSQLHPDSAAEEVAALSNMNYSNMTVAELKSLAKNKGIEGYSDMKKAKLIAVLQ